MSSSTWYRDEETRVVVSFVCCYQGRSYYRFTVGGDTMNSQEWVCRGSIGLLPQPALVSQWHEDGAAGPSALLLEVWDRYCAVQRAEWVRWCEKHDTDPSSYSNDRPGVKLS
jgi:hypothetical protein